MVKFWWTECAASQRMHARLASGRMFAHNVGNVALTLDRGTLTLVYDWWSRKLSIQANIAHGMWLFPNGYCLSSGCGNGARKNWE